MLQPSESVWAGLFADDETKEPAIVLRLQLLRRAGEPLLLAPIDPKSAAVALSLYPAQRAKARLVREGLRQAWRLGIPIKFETVTVCLKPGAPFPTFLAQWVEDRMADFPPLAVYCGNPKATGRRFVVLVFSPDRRPAAVIKAGVGEAAGRLVEREENFLASAPPGTAAVPKLRGSFCGSGLRAVALDFITGKPPAPNDYEGIGRLLTSWLDTRIMRPLGELPAWRAVEEASQSHPLWARAAAALRDRPVRPAIFHGDFAPWNIKVSPQDGLWTVLDWERGELTGIPGWDWFHYVFQYGVLVSRLPLSGAARRIRDLLHQKAFERYSAAASIAGVERELFLAYLICYSKRFGSPSGGADFEELARQLAQSWPND